MANGVFGLRRRFGRGIHGQSWNVRAHGTALFDFEHDRIENHHSTPASRRMRLPNRPASLFVWTATQISLPEVGCFNSRWLPFPDRTSTNPAAFSLRITSAQVTRPS